MGNHNARGTLLESLMPPYFGDKRLAPTGLGLGSTASATGEAFHAPEWTDGDSAPLEELMQAGLSMAQPTPGKAVVVLDLGGDCVLTGLKIKGYGMCHGIVWFDPHGPARWTHVDAPGPD